MWKRGVDANDPTEKAGKLARSSWASGRVSNFGPRAADKVIPHGVVPPSEVG